MGWYPRIKKFSRRPDVAKSVSQKANLGEKDEETLIVVKK